MFLQIILEHITHRLTDHTLYLTVAQLGLGLPFKLRLRHFHGDNGGQSLTEVVARNLNLVLFELVEHLVVAGIPLQGIGEGTTETGKMRTAFYCVDIIDVRVDIFVPAVVVLHHHLNRNPALLGLNINRRFHDLGTAAVKEADEVLQALFGVEGFALELPVVLLLAAVGELDAYFLVQECQFFQTAGQNVVLVFGHVENTVVGGKGDFCATVVGRAVLFHGVERLAIGELLHIMFAVAVNIGAEVLGKSIDAGDTHTVQTTGYLVGVFVELTARMKHREHHLQGGTMLLLVHVGRDTTTVVQYRYAVVFVYRHFNVIAVSGKRLVNGIVHHFIYQMVQSPLPNIADIHSRTLPHRLQSLQHLDVVRIVVFHMQFLFF